MWLRRGRIEVNFYDSLTIQWDAMKRHTSLTVQCETSKVCLTGVGKLGLCWVSMTQILGDERGGWQLRTISMLLTVNVCGAFLRNTIVIRHIFYCLVPSVSAFSTLWRMNCYNWTAQERENMPNNRIFFCITNILLFCTFFLYVAQLYCNSFFARNSWKQLTGRQV